MQEMVDGKEQEAEVGDVDISKKEIIGLFDAFPQYSSMIMIAINGSKSSRYALKWALNAFSPEGKFKFMLCFVCPPITSIPTPMGNHIPISQVREDVVSAYRKDLELQTLSMLFPYKEICMRKKVDFELLIKEADDVAEAIADDVCKFNISRLVIGDSSRNILTRKLKGIKLSAKIAEHAPSFCTVLVIKKGKLSAVRTGTEERSETDGASIDSSRQYSISCSDALQKSSLHPKSSLRVQFDENPSLIGYKYDEMDSPCSIIHSRSSSSNSDDDGSVIALPTSELHCSKSKISSYRNYQSRTKSPSSDWSSMSYIESNEVDLGLETVKPEFVHVHETNENAQESNVVSHEYKKYTWEEIEAATLSFSDSLKLGAGANGTVYRGTFLDTDAAVKILNTNEECETKQLKQEIEILSRIRHPNILLLFGACLEKGCLVYEYMENGSLDDRLHCKDNTPPLPWPQRLKIAWEVASALVFLHHSAPMPIIHRDLKPANILLDENFTSKIGDVGLSTLLPSMNLSLLTLCKDTAPVGTFFYIDPEYQRTGLVSPKSDTYALGMVILQLLTGKRPMGLAYTVEMAMEDGELMELLDDKAGKWPEDVAKDLALLGLGCLELRRKDRPDLKGYVLPVLERLKEIAEKFCGSIDCCV